MTRSNLGLWRAALALAAIAPLGAPVWATTIVSVDLAELTGSAGAIVRGRVTDVQAGWAPGRRRVQTRVTVAVDECFKGNLGPVVTLLVPGGRIGRYRSVLVGAPRFARGQHVILFLGWNGARAPYVLGLSQGLFRVTRDARSGEDVVVPRPFVAGDRPERIVRGDPDRAPMTLADFGAAVRQIVAGGRIR